MSVQIDIEKIISGIHDESILDILYKETEIVVGGSLDDLLKLPTNPNYKGNIDNYKPSLEKSKDNNNE
jgi:hypothetical protein